MVQTGEVWKGKGREVGAMASYISATLLQLFSLTFGYIVVIYSEVANILTPRRFILALGIWSAAGFVVVILMTLEIVLLGVLSEKK